MLSAWLVCYWEHKAWQQHTAAAEQNLAAVRAEAQKWQEVARAAQLEYDALLTQKAALQDERERRRCPRRHRLRLRCRAT